MFTCTRCLSSTENDNDLCDACVKRIYETPEFGGSMIRPDQIPDEVAFALLDIYALWHGDTAQARSAIAAALNAWQGIQGAWYEGDTPTAYILPLPQDNTND
jgi:hypothetical protein